MLKPNNNPESNLSQTTTTWTWVTPSVKPGQRTYRVMCHIITNALDEGERDYAVPLDSQTVDLVLDKEPCVEAILEALSCFFDMSQWRLMDWWQPETDGVADAF